MVKSVTAKPMRNDTHSISPRGKPLWLKREIPSGENYRMVRHLIKESRLHTICEEAICPNLGECYTNKTATFLILGNRCTRNCGFCAVNHGHPFPPEPQEPENIARTVQKMGLTYVVVTSVTRDDLGDGGAGHFAATIKAIRRKLPGMLIEVLVPDFQQKPDALQTVMEAHPNILNHNLETVPRLYPFVRSLANYRTSLDLLKQASQSDSRVFTKSGLMLGLGENPDEIHETLLDLLNTGCRLLTLGQYLQPSKTHLPVKRFVPPKEFDHWREIALGMGFIGVASGPLVRSSYHAKNLYHRAKDTFG
jgi:lipoic acid synthetase